jgi:hypothetical protein
VGFLRFRQKAPRPWARCGSFQTRAPEHSPRRRIPSDVAQAAWTFTTAEAAGGAVLSRCRGDRIERLERAKALGRIAYRLARAGEIVGSIEVEGEEKRPMEFTPRLNLHRDVAPWRSSACDTEFSNFCVMRAGGCSSFAGGRPDFFSFVLFKSGEWEGCLPRAP